MSTAYCELCKAPSQRMYLVDHEEMRGRRVLCHACVKALFDRGIRVKRVGTPRGRVNA